MRECRPSTVDPASGGDTQPSRAEAVPPAAGLLALVPGMATAYMAFSAGGFFPLAFSLVAVLLAALLIVGTLSGARVPRPTPSLALLAGALGLLAAWQLASGAWSGAEGRAFVEANRTLVYLLAVVLFGAFCSGPLRLRMLLRGTAAAVGVVCLAALVSRLIPGLLTVTTDNDVRLAFPMTYSNGLGSIMALGLVLAWHLTTDLREALVTRALAAAAIPAFAACLLFTLSRGAIVATVVGLAVLLIVSRPRGLPGGLLAAGPTGGVALLAAYGAELLFAPGPPSPAAVAQGADVALLVGVCAAGAGLLRAALAPLDRALDRVRVSPAARRTVLAGAAVAAIATLFVAGLVLDAPTRGADLYAQLIERDVVEIPSGDARQRLTDVGTNYRIEYWRVARDAFRKEPLAGHGAGTYETLWAQRRPVADEKVVDAHSLPLETAAELGMVGVVLLGAALLAVAGGLARRCRGPERGVFAACLAVFLTWNVTAALDWSWEMPAIGLWVFAAAGSALAAAPAWRPGVPRSRPRRAGAAVACLIPLGFATVLWLSDAHLRTAQAALRQGDCRAAISAARRSLTVTATRAEPYQVVGRCEAQRGRGTRAIGSYAAATRQDPENWRFRYELALALAREGRDPRSQAAAARRLNPRHRYSAIAARLARGDSPGVWRAEASRAPLAEEETAETRTQ